MATLIDIEKLHENNITVHMFKDARETCTFLFRMLSRVAPLALVRRQAGRSVRSNVIDLKLTISN